MIKGRAIVIAKVKKITDVDIRRSIARSGGLAAYLNAKFIGNNRKVLKRIPPKTNARS